jgi:hypothetical protein
MTTDHPNAAVRSCFQCQDGKYLVSVQMSRKEGGSIVTLTHDTSLEQWAQVRVEGNRIVGVRNG